MIDSGMEHGIQAPLKGREVQEAAFGLESSALVLSDCFLVGLLSCLAFDSVKR